MLSPMLTKTTPPDKIIRYRRIISRLYYVCNV